jgi:PTH1 family peptidyl-tRNA hydrolase
MPYELLMPGMGRENLGLGRWLRPFHDSSFSRPSFISALYPVVFYRYPISMGLFQKKILPIVVPRYSLGHQETLLLVGLGNIGKQYDSSRHNIGFAVLDQFAQSEEFSPWTDKKDLKSQLTAKIIDGKRVILCKPTTMMNLSGDAVQLVQNFYKIGSDKTCVIHDELDLELKTIRTQSQGQAAGHNGIKSLLAHINDTFWRIRIGIGPKPHPDMDSADFVLGKFSAEEITALANVKKEAISLLNEWIAGSASADTRKL